MTARCMSVDDIPGSNEPAACHYAATYALRYPSTWAPIRINLCRRHLLAQLLEGSARIAALAAFAVGAPAVITLGDD